MSDQRIFSSTRWQPKGAHVGSFWTVTSLSVEAAFGDDDGQVHLSGPGPCRQHQSVPIEEFLRNWECIDRCNVCDSPDVVTVRVVEDTTKVGPFSHRVRIVRCGKCLGVI